MLHNPFYVWIMAGYFQTHITFIETIIPCLLAMDIDDNYKTRTYLTNWVSSVVIVSAYNFN